jgi:hypothetical protein
VYIVSIKNAYPSSDGGLAERRLIDLLLKTRKELVNSVKSDASAILANLFACFDKILLTPSL